MPAERQFFSVEDDLTIEKRWHLEEPTHLKSAQPLDFWPLIAGKSIDPLAYRDINAPIQYEGPSLSFTLGAFLIPYVHYSIIKAVTAVDSRSTLFLPCLIGSRDLGFSILVATRTFKCLDVEASEIDYYTTEDLAEEEQANRDPARVGSIKSVFRTRIKRDRIANDCHVFRIAESLHDIIVSASVRETLIRAGVTGVTFHEV